MSIRAHKPLQLRREINLALPSEWQIYRSNTGLVVIVSMEMYTNGKEVLHISASAKDRLPTYYEMKELRYTLGGDAKYMAMIFPPPEEFVNLHENCLHLYELDPDVYTGLPTDIVHNKGEI